MIRLAKLAGFGLFIIVSTPSASLGATQTSTFTVTATVNATCNISTSPLAFGVYDPSSAKDGTTTLGVTCTNGTAYNIGLDAGTGSGATIDSRKMTSGAGTLTYSLFSNSGRTTTWGNTVGTNTVAGTGSGSQQSLTVYGRITSNQTSAIAGSYSDTITVTVTF